MFTAAEKTSFGKLAQASRITTLAMQELTAIHNGTAPWPAPGTIDAAMIQRIAKLCNNIGLEIERCMTFLGGGNGAASALDPYPATRAAAKTQAWFHLDRALQYRLELAGLNNTRASTVHAPGILNVINEVNRTLAYEEPVPMAPAVTIVGPHGEYKFAHWNTWRAVHYLREALDGAFNAYPNPAVDYGSIFQKGGLIADISTWALCRYVHADTFQTERDLRAQIPNPAGQEFFLLLRLFQWMTDKKFGTNGVNIGVPGRYQELQNAVLLHGLVTLNGGLTGCLSRIVDSWAHFDSGVWHAALAFPGANFTDNPGGAAAQLPSQQVSLALASTRTGSVTTVTGTATAPSNGQVLATATLDIADTFPPPEPVVVTLSQATDPATGVVTVTAVGTAGTMSDTETTTVTPPALSHTMGQSTDAATGVTTVTSTATAGVASDTKTETVNPFPVSVTLSSTHANKITTVTATAVAGPLSDTDTLLVPDHEIVLLVAPVLPDEVEVTNLLGQSETYRRQP